jgi:hypothetical protein
MHIFEVAAPVKSDIFLTKPEIARFRSTTPALRSKFSSRVSIEFPPGRKYRKMLVGLAFCSSGQLSGRALGKSFTDLRKNEVRERGWRIGLK